MPVGDIRAKYDPAGRYAQEPDAVFLKRVADFEGGGGTRTGNASPHLKVEKADYTALPRMVGGMVKSLAQDVANYPQARLLDPAVQAYRSVRGIAESDPAKRAANAQPTPDEKTRDQQARAFELSTMLGGPAEHFAAATVGRAPGILGRLLKNAATGAVVGGADSGVRNNDLKAVVPGAVGGAVAGPIAGEILHHVSGGTPKPEPMKIAPPVTEGVSEAARMKAIPNPAVKQRETGRGLKNLLMGYHAPEPLLVGKKLATGESLSDAFVTARRIQQDAGEEGTLSVKDLLDQHLTGTNVSKAHQAELIRQHHTAASMLADLENKKTPPQGFSPQQIEHDYIETAIALSHDPEAQAASHAIRSRYEQHHGEYVKRGYQLGEQKDYNPLKHLEQADQLLPESERAGRTPSHMKARGKEASLRDYDVIGHLAGYESAMKKKLAEDDLFTKIQNDPMNLLSTEAGRMQVKALGVPEGHVRYEAPMGSPGFGKAREAKVSSLAKESRNALLARKDLIQRAGREADAAATASLERVEAARRKSNLLEDNAKAISKSRALAEKSLALAKERQAKFETMGEGRLSRNAANATVLNREARLAKLSERETVLADRAQQAKERVARTEAEHGATAKLMQKKASSLMAKAEKVGRKAEKIKSQSSKKAVTMVLPVDVAEALSHFYERPMGHTARVADRAGQLMAQGATTLNLANRATNIPSDLWMTLAGPAGEKGTFTNGIAAKRLKNYPGAMASMLKHSFGGTSEAANAGRRLGAVSGTFQKEIGGVDVPHDLAPFYPPAPINERLAPWRVAGKIAKAPLSFMRHLSTATEAAPRLATSQEATGRGLPTEEVRRLAHESSLPYGAGASKFARSKPAKAFARFATYPSLADKRIVQGLLKGGSRTRYAALLTIPPAVAAQLNTRDAEHTAAEKRLKPWIKNTLHFLVKKDDGTFDVVVVRADPFSEATARWGLGQLSGRVVKAAKGVEPLDFSKAPGEVRDAYANFYPVAPIVESLKGKDQYNRKMTTADRVAHVLPFVRFGKEAFEEAQKGGVKAGAEYVVKRGFLSGARPLTQHESTGRQNSH